MLGSLTSEKTVLRAKGLFPGNVIEDGLDGVNLMAMRKEAQREAKETDNEENDGDEDHLNGRQVKGKVDDSEENDGSEKDEARREDVLRHRAVVDKVRQKRLNVVQKRTELEAAVKAIAGV